MINWIAAAGFMLMLAGITAGAPLLAYVGLGLAGGLPVLMMAAGGLLRLSQFARKPPSNTGDTASIPNASKDAGLPAWSPFTDADILRRLEEIVEEDGSTMDFLAVVDGETWSTLEQVPLLPDLLEEEPLVHGAWRSWRPKSITILLLAASMLVMFANLSWLFGTVGATMIFSPFYLCFMIGPFVGTPITSGISRFWSHVRPGFTMGTGFLRTRGTGRVIRTDQSILFVRRMASPSGLDDRIMVDLVGVQTRRLYYDGPNDPAFIDLWHRWIHPNPRPELATSDPSI